MKTFSRLLAVAAGVTAMLATTGAEASTAQAANITVMSPLNSGTVSVFMFNQAGTRTTPPSCATDTVRWVVDTTTLGGQAMVAVLLSAYAMGKQITVVGTGTCSAWGDSETVQYITVID